MPPEPEVPLLIYLNDIIALVQEMPFDVDISKLQDRCYNYLQSLLPEHIRSNDTEWIQQFRTLAERLHLEIPAVPDPVVTTESAA